MAEGDNKGTASETAGLGKAFDPEAAEPRLYEAWEQSGAFQPSDDPAAEPYTIVIPPPNVTGSLHMGHALNDTLQDILIRFERMRGKSVLWQVGMDHAGIATQMVVERQMAERQDKRTNYARDEFVEKVWDWKAESGGMIFKQLRRLGASCDWSRERFTMGEHGAPDDQMVKAVMKTFVALYKDDLIYRDKRLVNWDPKFETAISDLEVENTEIDGHFWHFKYPLENGETYEYVEKDADGTVTLRETRDYISIATTRPETMLGDGAVAVHPSDERYAPIVGKRCLLPLADRYIPIIADEHPDPDFGSGAVKITGAHDFNDYQVARRHDLPMYVLFDTKANMRADNSDDNPVPEKYRGLDRFEARKAVVADLDAEGRLIATEDKKIMQPFGDRSGVVIEPMLTDQWYVNAEKLAERAIKVVEDGETRFVPENWTKTYFQWMRNIEPWCISRQLWWGHRIPAWYGPGLPAGGYIRDDNDVSENLVVVAETEDEAILTFSKHYGEKVKISVVESFSGKARVTGYGLQATTRSGGGQVTSVDICQDPDVLDTWFSSGLWPFSTLGWPEETPALKKRYPTSVLVTAFDIIFFWVARMMMQGLYVMDEVPFKDVYIHALVLDEHGQKMSKSKGNVIDPLALIDKYGADPLRFTLAAQAAQGRNIRLSENRIEGYRNFVTKLWNAARFTEMNGCKPDPAFDPATVSSTLNKWIIHEANNCARDVTDGLVNYRFNDAAGAAYRFAWNVFCDWGLELAKPTLQGDDAAAKAETQRTIAWALDQILKLLHPFMPFVTEELWGALADRDQHLIVTAWPTHNEALIAEEAAAEIDWAIGLITAIRSVRAEMNIPAGSKIPLNAVAPDKQTSARLQSHEDAVMKLARIETLSTTPDTPKGAVQIVHDEAIFALPLAGVIDIGAEKARLQKEIDTVGAEIVKIDKKLANENFVAKAPPAVVEEQKTRRSDYEAQADKLRAALAKLADL